MRNVSVTKSRQYGDWNQMETKMQKFSLSFVAGLLSSVAAFSVMADTKQMYAAQTQAEVEFVYDEAVATNPIVVDASSDDGTCKFTVALTGVQQGSTFDSSIVGRIESGVCNGMPVHQGMVRASVTRAGEKVVLDHSMVVVVFN